jgi:hypothetical protein
MRKHAQTDPGDPGVPGGPQQDAPLPEKRDTFLVPEPHMPWLQGKIAKLVKVAQKLGVPPVTLQVLGDEVRDDPRDESGLQKLLYKKVKLRS